MSANDTSVPNCSTCMFYVPFDDSAQDLGQCRRYPPAVIVMPSLHSLPGGLTVSPAATFPPIQASRTWCGEYDDGGDDGGDDE